MCGCMSRAKVGEDFIPEHEYEEADEAAAGSAAGSAAGAGEARGNNSPRQVLVPHHPPWSEMQGAHMWSTVEELITSLQDMRLQPPMPVHVYGEWRQAARRAFREMPAGSVGEVVGKGLLCRGAPLGHHTAMSGPALANVHGHSLKNVEARPARKHQTLTVAEDRIARTYTSVPVGGMPMVFPEVGKPHVVRGSAWVCPGFFLTDSEVNVLFRQWRSLTGARWMAQSVHGVHVATPLVFKRLFAGDGMYVTGTDHCQTYCSGLVLGTQVPDKSDSRQADMDSVREQGRTRR